MKIFCIDVFLNIDINNICNNENIGTENFIFFIFNFLKELGYNNFENE